jgi:hypothetical protein
MKLHIQNQLSATRLRRATSSLAILVTSAFMAWTVFSGPVTADILPASKPKEWPAESADAKLAREAPQTLRTVERFTIGGVGKSGDPAQAELSFRALLKRPDAVAECQKLIADASPAGQLYGLLGLRLLDPKAFQTALPRYKGSKASIPTMSGCIVQQTTAGAVAADIEQGTIK